MFNNPASSTPNTIPLASPFTIRLMPDDVTKMAMHVRNAAAQFNFSENIFYTNGFQSQELICYPYLLKEYRNRWFLVTKPKKGTQLMMLALDRIIAFQELVKEKFVTYDGVDFGEYVKVLSPRLLANRISKRLVMAAAYYDNK